MDPDQFRALPSGGTMLDDNTELHVALADDRDAGAEARQLAALVDEVGPLRVVELFAGGGYHGRAPSPVRTCGPFDPDVDNPSLPRRTDAPIGDTTT